MLGVRSGHEFFLLQSQLLRTLRLLGAVLLVAVRTAQSTVVGTGAWLPVLPPFLLAVDFFTPFLPVPAPLSNVTSDLTFTLLGPISRRHFKYLAVIPDFSAMAIARVQILEALHSRQSSHLIFPFFYVVTLCGLSDIWLSTMYAVLSLQLGAG